MSLTKPRKLPAVWCRLRGLAQPALKTDSIMVSVPRIELRMIFCT
jgi:hypothetical protein